MASSRHAPRRRSLPLLLPPLLLLLLLSAHGALAGLAVSHGDVRPTPDTDDDHRSAFEQHWWVDASLSDGGWLSPATLREITLRVPGRVFVSQGGTWTSDRRGAPPSAATIRVSGDSPKLFEYLEVVATSTSAIEVRQRADATAPLRDVYLLIEIQLALAEQVQTLLSAGSADVVVEDRVLVASRLDAELQLSLTGSGSLFVASSVPTEVAKLLLNIAGSGDLSWSAPRLHVNAFMINVVGSGDAAVSADSIEVTAMDAHIAGSGDVCVRAPRYFRAEHLGTAILGSGDVALGSNDGRASSTELHVAGSGDVNVGEIVSDDVSVSVAGSGDVLVRAVHSIVGTTWGGGGVKYLGDRPERISDRRDVNVFSPEQSSKYKPVAKPRRVPRAVYCRVPAPPSRRAVVVSMNASTSKLLLVPLVVLALLAACYLRNQMKQRRQRPRFQADASSSFAERQPLQQPAMGPTYYSATGGYGVQQPQQLQPQQPQQQSSQVYV
ncbi:hypothetical protein PINS_up006555 [Pythium insidiosum]|nr:hypothetical protein PINS_up006555 [Pythium insidiosum]